MESKANSLRENALYTMKKLRVKRLTLVLYAVGLLLSPRILQAQVVQLKSPVVAQAGATRTFVATTGNDSNTSVNCSPSAPCRTFAAALSVTNSGGEIVVLTSGGYGPVTITQPVIITAIGVDASVSATSGGTAITINTTGNVTLIGLNLHGEGTGNDGVQVLKDGVVLRLYNMLIENFLYQGVDFEVAGNLEISGSSINDNNYGLDVNNPSANAYVHDTSFSNNSNFGVFVGSGQATVADSSAEYNNGAFASGGTLTLINDRVVFNFYGLAAALDGALYFANCLIANNSNAYVAGGTITGTNPGTSFIAPGQPKGGTLSAPIALQ